MDAGAHRSHRYVDGIGDLFVGEADDIAQHDRLPEVIRQLEERTLHIV
jgi:hypothetical protein